MKILFAIPQAFARLVVGVWARHRSALLFVVALAFGALAVAGARGYIAEQVEHERARLVTKQPMAEVVVAKRDLERGAVVTPESMAVRPVPADVLPGSVVRPERFGQHVGARLAVPMRSGEPLLSSAIVGGDVGTFSSRIRPGIRAMSILVDEVNSVSGMLQPGDRIDLLFTVRPPGAPGQPPAQEVTGTLMQDLAVLATGRQVRAGVDGVDGVGGAGREGGSNALRHFTAITVEVSAEQAQRLIVAQRTGKLTAMLRHPDDRQPLRAPALDLNTLLGLTPAQARREIVQASGPEIIVGGRGNLAPVAALERLVVERTDETVRGAAAGAATGSGVGAAFGMAATPGMAAAPGTAAAPWALHRFAPAAAPTPAPTVAAPTERRNPPQTIAP